MHDSSRCPVCSVERPAGIMSDEEFCSFLQMCRDELAARQEWLEKITLGTSWHYDLDEGLMRIGENVFPITAIGSHSDEYGTWLWAWANEDFPPVARKASKRLQALYGVTGFQVFLDPGIAATSKDAQDFAAVAVHCLEALGMFRVPGSPALYLAVHDQTDLGQGFLTGGGAPPDVVEDGLTLSLKEHGFRRVLDIERVIDATLVLKRQTWNTNRALVVVRPQSIPEDFPAYMRQMRKQVAWRCGFFPGLWGIGIQVVVIADGLSVSSIDPSLHVARVDNQWAIVQSLFLADPATQICRVARSPGQFITGKFQLCIARILSLYFGGKCEGG